MERVFANFQINDDFYLMLFLFLLITIIISTLIVIFLTKIHGLMAILEHAKEIDHAKEERLAFLEDALMEEKIHSFQLQKKMDSLQKHRRDLELSKVRLRQVKEQLFYQEKNYLEFSHKQESALAQLKHHYAVLEESHELVDEKYLALKQQNEDLFDAYNQLNRQNRALELKFLEEKKKYQKTLYPRNAFVN